MIESKRTDTRRVSVVIPARNEAESIGNVVRSVSRQCPQETELEIIVVDDASIDDTAANAARAGARVLSLARSHGGNPAAARNRGAAASTGDPIIFLDSDCMPHDRWLEKLLARHDQGIDVVGGSLALPVGLSLTARCDYYCGWYHVHPQRCGGSVRHHPPCNLSVRRKPFLQTSGFLERQPAAYAHEELLWQAEIQELGSRIYFEPLAVADHRNRPGFSNLLRRNYRWAYSAIETKAESGVARMGWLYRYPRLMILVGMPLSLISIPYIIYCWLQARIWEPLWLCPWIIAARVAYGVGMIAGGTSWIRGRNGPAVDRRPRWE